MAEHTHSGPVEVGAPMDYDAHQRTFAAFVTLTKIGVLATISILQSLTLFGIAAHGFWLGVLVILLMFVATAIGILTKGSIKPLIGVVILGFVFMVLALG
jgi:Bacterial aa3 type cytochrome c oxidase subunit IV